MVTAEVYLIRIILWWCKIHECSEEMIEFVNNLQSPKIMKILNEYIDNYYDVTVCDMNAYKVRTMKVVECLKLLYEESLNE